MKDTELQILTGSVALQCTHKIDKHLDGYYTIQFMTTGGVELFYDDQRYQMEGAWFWPAYPGPHIRFHVALGYASWEHRHVAFRGPLVQQWITEGLFPTCPQPAEQNKDYCALFDRLLVQIKRTDHWGRRRAIHMLEGLLIDLAEARTQFMPQRPWVQEVLDLFIQGETDFMPDYEQLALRYSMSVSSFRRQFRQATGTAIHMYVLQCRVARAKTLLIETDLPMKFIAQQLGYSDVYYFSRQFHELVGITPTIYRKSQHLY
jgi:AraC-like DNA-binding protein